jgi:hypothetical protein
MRGTAPRCDVHCIAGDETAFGAIAVVQSSLQVHGMSPRKPGNLLRNVLNINMRLRDEYVSSGKPGDD